MSIVDTTSLAATVDAVNDTHFTGTKLSQANRNAAAKFIASRQGLRGSYSGMFAPTEKDFADGIRFFTGERVATRAGVSHIIGQESCRALALLAAPDPDAHAALAKSLGNIAGIIRCGVETGRYCCGKCSVSLWRHMAVGLEPRADKILAAGLKHLHAVRDGEGRWKAMPFYYTLSALLEMNLRAAVAEMRYAAPLLERAANQKRDDIYSQRRSAIAQRVLAIV
jgi:hypothetical protein